ncbi:MAG: hypothetical protein FWE28_08355 [Oscillospiraceae bacterium]|nr:hypothetical protein [Oscillospiraceae bacterium]
MRKRYSFENLFEGNKVVLMCILFTVHIILETIFSTIAGRTTYLSMGMLIWSLVALVAPILPIALFQYLWKSDFISDKDYLFWGAIPSHYIISCGLTLLFTFIRSFFELLPQNFYLVAFINYTAIYLIILIGAVVVDLTQTANANDNLRKIQTHLSNTNKKVGE